MAPILKAYARFKAAKIKEVILHENSLNTDHISNLNNNNNNKSNNKNGKGQRSASEVTIDEVILKRMSEANMCGNFNNSHVCRLL